VLREADQLLEGLEQLANRGVPLRFAEVSSFLDPVVDEQSSNRVWIVVVIADCAVTRLQFFDGFTVRNSSNTFF
jgi:hypothetical protein